MSKIKVSKNPCFYPTVKLFSAQSLFRNFHFLTKVNKARLYSLITVHIEPSMLSSKTISKKQKSKKVHMYPNVHRSTVYNSQDMEAT